MVIFYFLNYVMYNSESKSNPNTFYLLLVGLRTHAAFGVNPPEVLANYKNLLTAFYIKYFSCLF